MSQDLRERLLTEIKQKWPERAATVESRGFVRVPTPRPGGLTHELINLCLDITVPHIEAEDAMATQALKDRDHWMERFDKLVYSLATVEDVGEWSSGNDIGENLIDHIGGTIQQLERKVEEQMRTIAGLQSARAA